MEVDTLKMGWCKIGGGDGARAMADLVMFNTTLRSLDLRGNGFGNDGEFLRLQEAACIAFHRLSFSLSLSVSLSEDVIADFSNVSICVPYDAQAPSSSLEVCASTPIQT